MQPRSASKESTYRQPDHRRRIDLFQFGYIEYQPGANCVSGSFELHSPAIEPRAETESLENDSRDPNRKAGTRRHTYSEDRGND